MKRVIASAGLLALSAAGAAAQLITADKPWSISGSLRGFYDDNVNTAPEGPGKVDSFGFEIGPAAAVDFNWGPTTFKGSYAYWNRTISNGGTRIKATTLNSSSIIIFPRAIPSD